MMLELIALLCAGVFAGAAVYVTLVEHPARLECGPAVALAEFRPSYRRGAVVQAALAAIGLLAAVGAWALGQGVPTLVAGLSLGALIPFTLLVILPTNKRLLDSKLDPHSTEAAALLARWGRLHMVRAIAGVVAFVLLALDLAGTL
jgi:Anthrone oxygenase